MEKRYPEMSRDERIADSDEAAIRELERKLHKKCPTLQKDLIASLIEEWIRKYNIKIVKKP
jgi:hypothetical protein